MNPKRVSLFLGLLAGLALVLTACSNGSSGGRSNLAFDTPFDFKDSFYLKHGLNPEFFVNRVTPDSPNCTWDRSPDPVRNQTRILEVNGGFDAVGELLYYPAPPAFFPAEAFMDNPTGVHARELADQFRAFIFPFRDGGQPLVPAPSNRRQDNVFDTSSGYHTTNPLGLWRITFPRYTDAALNTPEGIAKLDEIRALNGTDLDGTPILKRLAEINELEELGFLELLQRADDGSDGPPWVV